MIRCPNCGAYLDIQKPTLTWRQQQIRRFIRDIVRDTKRPAKTIELADKLELHPRTVRIELTYLEQMGEICRPSGPRSGWDLHERHIILTRELNSEIA